MLKIIEDKELAKQIILPAISKIIYGSEFMFSWLVIIL